MASSYPIYGIRIYGKYTLEGQTAIIIIMLGLFMFISGYLLGRKPLSSKEEIKCKHPTPF